MDTDTCLYDSLLTALETEYKQERVLKQSADKMVVLVRHKQSGSRFVLRRFYGDDAVYRKLLPLCCPNLPKILETASKDGQVLVLEEYIQGDDLGFLLACEPLTPAQAVDIVRQIGQALHVLHAVGAVHRDIKPENVIIRGREAVLIDFDASRIYKEENETDTQILGTIGYAAPEQFGMSQSDASADIYALGVMLNVMLTGQHPSKQLAAGRLGRIVRKCTMVNPKQRYRSVLHLMEVLS